jgi:Protein of unknown function (DUF2867)
MNTRPRETAAPLNSLIANLLVGADFHDSWAIESSAVELPALGHFIEAVKQTPRWVDACMAFRNKTVALFGLKNLGNLAVTFDKSPSEYIPGDRVGIFTLFENTSDEVLLGDKDKHLDVILSVHRTLLPGAAKVVVTVTTVVHVKNTLGRLYMLPVKPMHRLIAPTVLGAIGRA